MPTTVHEKNLKEILEQSEELVLLDFWAEWCGPCQVMDSLLHQLEKEHDGRFILGKINVDEEPTLSALFGIRSIPTLLFFRKGEQVDQLVGTVTKRLLGRVIEKWLPEN